MVAVPPDTPVTTPVGLTVAVPELLLHTPPEVVLDMVIVSGTQTLDGPVMGVTVGSGLTVMMVVAETEPQLLVTV
jgi:hypothetical protein